MKTYTTTQLMKVLGVSRNTVFRWTSGMLYGGIKLKSTRLMDKKHRPRVIKHSDLVDFFKKTGYLIKIGR